MSSAFQNLALSAQQKQGADWAENTTLRETTQGQSEARLPGLSRWISGRTYNKGDLSIEGGKFTAINSHVHFRFLNNDRQTEQDIKDVRQAVYDVFAYKFNTGPALKALQEFLFGPTATHEPLTCDEVYSMLRLIDSNVLQNATYEELAAFLKTAHDVKHSNMAPGRLDAVRVTVGGRRFGIGDFIKGYGKHSSVRKTTVNIDSYNEIIRRENRIRGNFQRKIERKCANAEEKILKLGWRQEEFLEWIDDLNEFLRTLADDNGKNDPRLIADDFVNLVDSCLESLDLKNAPDSLKVPFQPIVDVQKKCRELLEELKGERLDKDGDLEMILLSAAEKGEKMKDLRDLLKGERLTTGVASLRQEVLRHFEGSVKEKRRMPSKLLFTFDRGDAEEYFSYLVERAALHNETHGSVKRFARGLEFLKSLEDGGRKLSPDEKLKMLTKHLSQVFEERVARFPDARGNPALRAALLDLMMNEVRMMSNRLLNVELEVASEGYANISQRIEDDYKILRVLLDFFNEDGADNALRTHFGDIVRVADPNTPKGVSMLVMLSRLMHVVSPAEGVPASRERKQVRLDQFNAYLKDRYGTSVKPLIMGQIEFWQSDPALILSDADRRVAKVVDRLLDKGYSQATIDGAFELGNLHAAAVVFGTSSLQELALAAIKRNNLDENDHAEGIDGDEVLLAQMRRGLPSDVRERIRGALGLDEEGLDVRVDVLVQDPEESVRNANNFRQAFTRTLKDLGLYDLADRTLLGDILKYAMFASHMDMDKFVAKVVKGVYGSGHGNVVRRLLCGLRVRIAELKFRIELCQRFVDHGRAEQTKQRKANRDEVDSAKGVGVVFSTIAWDTKDSETIFEDMYKALAKVRRDSAEVLGDELVRKVEWYVVQMQELDSRVKRWFAVLTGEDANLGLQVDVKSERINGLETGGSDFVTHIHVSDPRVEGGEVRVDVSREAIMAKLKADLADLAGKSINEGGAVIGAPTIGSVLDPEQINAA